MCGGGYWQHVMSEVQSVVALSIYIFDWVYRYNDKYYLAESVGENIVVVWITLSDLETTTLFVRLTVIIIYEGVIFSGY